MKIDLHKISIRDVFAGYKDSAEDGVVAYNGKLDIRPKYQREFVYKPEQRNAVMHTVRHNFPLNIMYWIENTTGNYELLDGQQRTLSICQYVNGDFSINDRYFDNLTKEEQEQILGYELMVYFCDGTDKERIEWFAVINTAGERLTSQELLNAVYTGPWLSDAKLKFSKSSCAAYLLANDGGALVNGSPIRQEYLETALSWINSGDVAGYMAKHQHDGDAEELWQYFQDVIAWVRKTFVKYRKDMKGVEWGRLYNKYRSEIFDSNVIEKKTLELIDDDDVQSLRGIYEYILSGEEKHLSLRQFDDKIKRKVFEKQKGKCVRCKKIFQIEDMEADHITPWHEGGKTTLENCQMLCKDDNRRKSGK